MKAQELRNMTAEQLTEQTRRLVYAFAACRFKLAYPIKPILHGFGNGGKRRPFTRARVDGTHPL